MGTTARGSRPACQRSISARCIALLSVVTDFSAEQKLIRPGRAQNPLAEYPRIRARENLIYSQSSFLLLPSVQILLCSLIEQVPKTTIHVVLRVSAHFRNLKDVRSIVFQESGSFDGGSGFLHARCRIAPCIPRLYGSRE
jgi:hypothetical protein